MFRLPFSSVLSSFEVVLLITLTALHTATSQTDLTHCHCNINRQRGSAVDIACSKSKDRDGPRLDCKKVPIGDVPVGYEYVEPWGLFKLYRTHLTRDAAYDVCVRHGGRLAIPKDNGTAAALGRLVKEEPGVDAAFVGIHDIMTEGNFFNDDGSTATYQVWRNKEPRHGSGDDTCVAMTDDGRIDGLKCEVPSPFLCERPQSTALPPGYQYVPAASAFLRLYTSEKVAYSSAQKICESDGGGLAVPDTWLRAEAMLRLIPPGTGHVYVGLNDMQTEGSFVTSDNSRYLSDMEFDAWEPGQPDNGDGYGYEDCLAVHHNGTMFDVVCDLKLPFFCELPPP